ncbi:hypothetical protein SNE40_007251 [Patella caerulea]|uniref:L-Fucosyltransferase n=2 Tax=Patella caerulea TaxID=87958 RepID=A0AAN8JTF4_PATCE
MEAPRLFEEMKRRIIEIKHWNSTFGNGIFPKATNSVVGVLPVQNARTPLFKNHYIVFNNMMGRLGNHLFQFAALIGIANQHGYTPVLLRLSSLKSIFDIDVQTKVPTLTNQKSFSEKRAGIYDTRITNLTHSANWTLNGYFQSWKYFHASVNILRKQLKFKENILKQARNKLLPTKGKIRIGIHVRRGDMNSRYALKRGYNVADVGYLNRSMDYFRRKFGAVSFVMVSDDVKWCEANIKSKDLSIMGVSREVDLAILSLCDHNIVTTGSFGWWGAWLAGGEVVYFKNYPKNNTWLDKQYNKHDYYPSNWLGMT